MEITLPYGDEQVTCEIGWGRCIGTLDIADAPPLGDPAARLLEALETPIGQDRPVAQSVRPGERVAIIVSDSFRNTGVDQLLPALLDTLHSAGVSDHDIIIVFATGTHRAPNPTEQRRILGDGVYKRFEGRRFVHDAYDASNLTHIGDTSRGTPVYINRRVHECDRIIATGTVVFHYHGGFGGGRKSIVPGIASAETITHNHGLNLDPNSDRINPAVRIGALDGNPVSEDMLEGSRLAGVDAIINTVMNREGQIAAVFAGDMDAAHRAAADFARRMYAAPITEQADLVSASSGGNRNFVQSHKALFNAYQAVRAGGRIILLARCEEGLGSERLARWLGLRAPGAIIHALREQGEIYGQTALSTVQKSPQTFLVTDLSDEEVELIGAQRALNLKEALMLARHAFLSQGVEQPRYYVMPSAAYSVPFLESPAPGTQQQ